MNWCCLPSRAPAAAADRRRRARGGCFPCCRIAGRPTVRSGFPDKSAGAERSARAESAYAPVRGAACVCRDKPIGALSRASNDVAVGPRVGRPGHGRCPRDVCRGLEVQPASQTKSGRGRAPSRIGLAVAHGFIASRRPRGPACRSCDGLRHRPGARPGPKHRAHEREHRDAAWFWPQTETIRVLCREASSGKAWPNLFSEITDRLFRTHQLADLNGGRIDQVDGNGTDRVDYMPANTLCVSKAVWMAPAWSRSRRHERRRRWNFDSD